MPNLQRPKIFITHSSHDIAFARRLHDDLNAQGFELWFDDKTLQAGHRLAEEINRGLEWCDVYIPVISRASLASKWCWEEINAAISLSNQPARSGRPTIIPVTAEDIAVDMPALLASRLYINFARRYDEGLQELVTKGLSHSASVSPSSKLPLRPAHTAGASAPQFKRGIPSWILGCAIGVLSVVLLLVCGVMIYLAPRSTVDPTPTTQVYVSPVPPPPVVPTMSPLTAIPTSVSIPPKVPNPPTPVLMPPTWTPIPTQIPPIFSPTPGTRVLFFDDFDGPSANPIYQAYLPDAPFRFTIPDIAAYKGASNYSFQKVGGSSVIRLKNGLGDAQRKGWSTSSSYYADNETMRLEARFNTLVQSSSAGIDQMLELWLIDASNPSRFDKVTLLTWGYGERRWFTAGSSLISTGIDTEFLFRDNTWYRMVIASSSTQQVRASIYDDNGSTELIGVDLGHNLSKYPAGFKIGISQSMGFPNGVYSTDVAIDWVRLSLRPTP